MNLRTKLAITGVGVAVLMLLAFLTPAEPDSVEHRVQNFPLSAQNCLVWI
jgi:hypothetical protein